MNVLDHDTVSEYLILFVLWLVVFSFASQVMIIAPILPRIAEQLGATVGLLGTLITAYAFAVGVFALIAGPVSDRIGRRRILLIGTTLMTIALAAHGFVESFASLFAVRAFAGGAGGVLNGAAIAYIGDYFPRERRGWASGWVLSGLAAGQIAGVPLGIIFANALGFRAPFVVFAVVMGIASVLVWRFVPQPDARRSERPLGVHNAVAEYASLLRQPGVAAASVMFALVFLSFPLYIAYLPLWLETTFGATGETIALLFFLGGVGNVIAGPEAGRLSDRVGRKPVIIGASLAVTAVILVTPFVNVTLWPIYVVFSVAMGLFASRGSSFQALLTELVSDERRGALMSLTAATGQIGFAIGGALAGLVFTAFGPGYLANAGLSAAGCFVLAVVAWRYLPEPSFNDVDREEMKAEKTPSSESRSLAETACRQSSDALCGPHQETGHMIPEHESK